MKKKHIALILIALGIVVAFLTIRPKQAYSPELAEAINSLRNATRHIAKR